MYFQNVNDFLAMGGHGLYVWLAYGIAVVIFIFNVVSPLIKRKQVLTELARLKWREGQQ